MKNLFFFLFIIFSYQIVDAQAYGFNIGTTLYQPRTAVAQYDPSVGLEIGPSAKFYFSEKKYALVINFGYLMGHSVAKDFPIISKKSGNNYLANCDFLNHFLNFNMNFKLNFLENEKIGFYFGPDLNYLIGQTLFATYEASPDFFIRETLDGNLQNVEKFYPNIKLGAELNLFQNDKSQGFLYAAISAQIKRFAINGAFIGYRMYFGSFK